MSHFTVLVIGDNPEEQLAPYHEFECTGYDDKYVVDVDRTEEVQEKIDEYAAMPEGERIEDPLTSALQWFGLEERVISDESERDPGDHKYGFAVVQDGKLIKAVRRTNPNAKWDWYLLGGRWTGYFKLKPDHVGMAGEPGIMTKCAKPGYADQTLLENIDIEAMRDEEGSRALEQYEKIMEVFGDTEPNKTWEEIEAENPDMDVEQRRELFWSQPRCKAWKESEYTKFMWRSSPDDFRHSREEHVQRARKGALSTFAVVKDGQWHERGSMGWWGCVSDEKDPDAWERQFGELIDGLPGETLLSVYDCHI